MVGILNFVVNLLPTLLKLYLKHRYKREHFQVVAKKLSCASAQNAR